ncbi:hypothetical protein [Sorangium sp. So ce233]|uniref:hypothetical protein n=1 Tax=Sorangium sp. So ce233 TaxID=3133290 RepID=UPI003F5EEE57
MDKVTAADTLGFEVSSAVAGELSASSQGGRRSRSNWHNEWFNYIYSDTPRGESSAATKAPFDELLRRVSTTT